MPRLLLASIFLLFGYASQAQNSCGMKASFTPGNDTTLYVGQQIQFTNTSVNADSYEWIVDHYFKYTSTDYTFVPAVGITQILLVAHRGTCTDTAVTYVVRNGTPPLDPGKMFTMYGLSNTHEYASQIVRAKTDGYLLSGTSSLVDPVYGASPYFVRISETGCVLWSKMLPQNYMTVVSSVIATYDFGFVVQVVLKNDIDKSYIVKLDKDGNILWSRTYTGTHALNWNGTLKEMANHSIWLLGGNFNENFIVTELSEAGGINWQKVYSFPPGDTGLFVDVVQKNGAAYIAANYYKAAVNPPTNYLTYGLLLKVNVSDGTALWVKAYKSPNTLYFWNGIQLYKGGLIMHGFSDTLTNAANARYDHFMTIQETDLDGNELGAKMIYNNTFALPSPIGINLIINPDNSLLLFNSFGNIGFFLKLEENKTIAWQKSYYGVPSETGYLTQAVAAPGQGLAMVGTRFSVLQSPVYGIANNYFVLKVGADGEGSDPLCYQYVTTSVVQDLAIQPITPPMPLQAAGIPTPITSNISATSPNTELRYQCPDYVPLCSFMKLSGTSVVCNLKDTFDFIAHKDPACGDPVIWTYDGVNIKTAYQDGSKARLIFKTPGIYIIHAEKPFPCTPITDSIIVTVAPGLVDFNLGKDTTLCWYDSITVRPTGKYSQCLWQDGSTNDSLKIKTSGLYYLQVTDSCGNTKSDSILVSFLHNRAPDLGAPRLKCASDSLLINAPVGFIKYVWTPDYNLLLSATNNVTLYPRFDTTYKLTVTDILGCIFSSELQIHNYSGSVVDLGKDTSICVGGVAVFTAIGNFTSYAWNNGANTASINVQIAGKYFVRVTDANNCVASDTISLFIYPASNEQISGGYALCKDQPLMLDAGSGYSTYLWQDGSHTQRFTVTDTGYYHVEVSDAHTCLAADSIHIANYAENPAGFLPADTSICMYAPGTLQPNQNFIEYNWSTGENTKSIQVKLAGDYTLQVVDQLGCRGLDSIHIELKDCEAVLVFPNAFTPNKDGVNDVFRLRYPGNLANYDLQIFNRWGVMVFHSTDPFGSWDGSLHGESSPQGTYVWIVRYMNRSGKAQTLNGTVVLIR